MSRRTAPSLPMLLVLSLAGCSASEPAGDDAGLTVGSADLSPPFVDAAAAAGLDFLHDNGARGALRMPEIIGSGVGVLDFDRDGLLDIYLVQGVRAPSASANAASGDRLFRNLGVHHASSAGSLRFEDVTAASGIARDERGHAAIAALGMGVAVGDYDGDGHPDIYLANLGGNRLLRNLGDGRFVDVTHQAGVGDSAWSVGASFHDLDGDGRLDLYVVNYLDYRADETKQCFSPAGQLDYCGPKAYDPTPNTLYRNLGDGRFEDVSERAGIRAFAGASLGSVILDFDGDSLPDIYVANDGMANELWLNNGDFSFRNEALLAGVAVNADGRAEAGMGVDAADCDGDGRDDIIVSHLTNEHNTLYLQTGAGTFRDETRLRGIAMPSWSYTGFGIAFLDYDLDGWLDLASVNGLVTLAESRLGDGAFPLQQPDQLLRNRGDCRFEDVSEQVPAMLDPAVGRGLAVGDFDNDGRPDMVVSNAGDRPRLLLNQAGAGRHWLGLRLLDGGSDAIGARAGLRQANGRMLWRRVRSDGSYASANDPRLLFGLGAEGAPVDVVVRWADGSELRATGLAVDRYHLLTKADAAP